MARISCDDAFISDKERLLTDHESDTFREVSDRKRSILALSIPWTLCIVLTSVLFFRELQHAYRLNVPYWTASDFVTVKKEIIPQTETVRFTAGLRFNESKQLYRPIHPGQPQYVGESISEIDTAWKELIGAINVFVKPEEEASLGGGLYFQPDSKLYMAQVTVFHDLHCLNMLRQQLPHYRDHYDLSDGTIPHLDHCIDSLRLSLMCAGDMTLSPIIWSYEMGRIIPDFEVDHTCRNYAALKDWADARDSADPIRYPINEVRLHAEIGDKFP